MQGENHCRYLYIGGCGRRDIWPLDVRFSFFLLLDSDASRAGFLFTPL